VLFRIERIREYPIWHVRFPDAHTLALTFLRMQEHYESPKFRGTVFSLDEFKRWYIDGHGSFSYPEFWTAFNVPSAAVLAVYKDFPDHSPEERALFAELDRLGILDLDRFYLIGTCDEEPEDLDHEIRHGMYFCNGAYRAEIDAVLRRHPVPELREHLMAMGDYCPEVIDDEVHAWTLTGWPDGLTVTPAMLALKRELQEVEKKYL
jgi:hypothetical protein